MSRWRVPFPKFAAGPGLERVAAVAARLGLDLSGFGAGAIAVVGSNGKGSTAAMIAALLEPQGGPVGLFTSPHLFRLNERFRIDGQDISDAALAMHWERVLDAAGDARERENLGGFEFLFLIAADWFATCDCARTVWEAGIGGRLDPVRLVEARRVALAALDLEHTELLGATLEAIALEKTAIAPRDALMFAAAASVRAAPAISADCERRGVDLRIVEAASLAPLEPPLRGAHQRENAALAVAVARDAAALDANAVRAGLGRTRWPGRLEAIGADPLVVVDVGHTPGAIRVGREGFAAMAAGRPSVLVCGASHDKDIAGIIGALAPGFEVIVCVAARHKGAPAEVVARHVRVANPLARLEIAAGVEQAREMALARAGAAGAVYVAGGLFLAAEFKAAQLGLDPASLDFF